MTENQPSNQGTEDLIPADAGLTARECPHHFDCDGVRCDPTVVGDVPVSTAARVELDETITDPAQIRATDEPDERTTPAPVGAAVALDLDAIEEAALADDGWWSFPASALVAEVRRLTGSLEVVDQRLAPPLGRPGQAEDAIRFARLHVEAALAGRSRPLALATARAESAEAEVGRLRAKLAAGLGRVGRMIECVEAGCQPYGGMCHGYDTTDDDECALIADLSNIAAALAVTTGEGE